MCDVRALGGAALVGLVVCGLLLNLRGISESTAAIVGVAAALAAWSVIVYRSTAKVESEGNAVRHYALVPAWLRPGLAYIDAGQYQRAIAFFNQAIKSQPDCADAYFGRGLVYHELEQYQQATADFDRVIEIDPDHPYAHFQRGFAHYQLEQYQLAVADLTRALEIRPDEWAFMLRGSAYKKLGQEQQAEADYERAGQMSPRPPRAKEEAELPDPSEPRRPE